MKYRKSSLSVLDKFSLFKSNLYIGENTFENVICFHAERAVTVVFQLPPQFFRALCALCSTMSFIIHLTG